LDFLKQHPHFWTAQQIHEQLRLEGHTISLPTVYRSLARLVSTQAVDQRVLAGQASYRRCSTKHHHHLVCRQCGATIELSDAPLEQWVQATAQAHGFADVSHLTEIVGTCPDCQIGRPALQATANQPGREREER
jgi:Fur family ferric uptake transcriptional regulator